MPEIVYEDNHLLIVVKPPNQLTQSDETGDLSLQEECKAYLKEKYQKPGEVYLGLVHRLDRPVGGLVAFARTSKAAARLSEQLRSHAMHRDYYCVVEDAEEKLPPEATLTHYLLKDESSGSVHAVRMQESAQKAVLHYRVLGRRCGTALLQVSLETGRKHQIRVQMAAVGHPIVYDMRYGKGKSGENISLWGVSLSLCHPTLKKEMHWFSLPRGGAFSLYENEIQSRLQNRQEETI